MRARSCTIAMWSASRSGECESSFNPRSGRKWFRTFWKRLSTGRCLHLPRQTETVTHPRFRKQVLGVGWILFDLLPKLIDEHPEVLHLVAVVGSPHRLQQLCMGYGN